MNQTTALEEKVISMADWKLKKDSSPQLKSYMNAISVLKNGDLLLETQAFITELHGHSVNIDLLNKGKLLVKEIASRVTVQTPEILTSLHKIQAKLDIKIGDYQRNNPGSPTIQ